MWSYVTNIRNIEPLFGLPCFHHSSLTFRGTHTSCSCLVWFPFLISITHNSKNWVTIMENENKFLMFSDFQNWVTMAILQFCSFSWVPHVCVVNIEVRVPHALQWPNHCAHTKLMLFLHFSLVSLSLTHFF